MSHPYQTYIKPEISPDMVKKSNGLEELMQKEQELLKKSDELHKQLKAQQTGEDTSLSSRPELVRQWNENYSSLLDVQKKIGTTGRAINHAKVNDIDARRKLQARTFRNQFRNFIRCGNNDPNGLLKTQESIDTDPEVRSRYNEYYSSDKHIEQNTWVYDMPQNVWDAGITKLKKHNGIRAEVVSDGVDTDFALDEDGSGFSDFSTTVDDELKNNLIFKLISFGGIMSAVKIVSTPRGNKQTWNRYDSGKRKGRYLRASNTAPKSAQRQLIKPTTLPSPTTVEMGAHVVTSDYVDLAREMLADTEPNPSVINVTMMDLTKRIALAGDDAFNAGDLVGNKRQTHIGIKMFAGDGGMTDAVGKVGWKDMFRLETEIEDAYLRGFESSDPDSGGFTNRPEGMPLFMLSRDIIDGLLLETDNENRPIWTPNISARGFSTIKGFPTLINYSLDNLATGSKSLGFGRWDHYCIRQVRRLHVFRLGGTFHAIERYADGVVIFARHDGYHLGPVDKDGKAEGYKFMTTK